MAEQSSFKKFFPYIMLVAGLLIGIILVKTFSSGGPTGPLSGATMTEDDWVKGNRNASVTLIEYSDFQCPACGSYYPVLKQLSEEFPDELAFVYRHFPLTMSHPNALAAGRAAEAAGRQGKFWEMHDKLFENQNGWSRENNPKDRFMEYAGGLELNMDQFEQDYEDQAVKDEVEKDMLSGNSLGVNSTPTFYLNGEKIQNPSSFAAFQQIVRDAIAKAPLTQDPNAAIHIHSDLAIYVNGKAVDLSLPKYQSDVPDTTSTEDHEVLDTDVHLHNENGTIIHYHKPQIPLARFFSSLGMTLTNTCLTLDTGVAHCTDDKNSLKFFVNGVRQENPADFVARDLDQILVSYGPLGDSALKAQIDAVGDEACIYSEKCPERGAPPDEQCVGGLGTNCN